MEFFYTFRSIKCLIFFFFVPFPLFYVRHCAMLERFMCLRKGDRLTPLYLKLKESQPA